jgi:hypothetical protein
VRIFLRLRPYKIDIDFVSAMVVDEIDARFIRIDRLRLRERERGGTQRVSVAIPFPFTS